MRQIYYPRSFFYVSQHGLVELSPRAAERLRWLKAWRALTGRGVKSGEAAEALRLPRSTLYRWERRLKAEGLPGLEDRSRRPKRVRPREWGAELAMRVCRLREGVPGWGKDKLAPLLWEMGESVSISTVGRILSHLKAHHRLVEAPRTGVGLRRRAFRRPYAVRKPRGYVVRQPGDMVQLDTVEVRPLPGVVIKQFTARDVVSRWDVLEAHSRATAGTASGFLDRLQARMPFPVKAIQVDGGSEFQAEFEQACARKGIRLFVLPPRSPKLNGCVERAQRTHKEEFYAYYDGALDLKSLNQALRQWEQVYNTIRPHHSLGRRSPMKYLRETFPKMAPMAPPISYVLNEYMTLNLLPGNCRLTASILRRPSSTLNLTKTASSSPFMRPTLAFLTDVWPLGSQLLQRRASCLSPSGVYSNRIWRS
jgi:putative transposase